MKRLFFLTLLVPFILGGCNKSNQTSEQEQYINVQVNELTLEEEEQYQIVTDIIKKGTIVFYSSSNEEVASVTDEGLITAHQQGNAIINVRGGKDTYSIFVTVVPFQAKDSLQIVLLKEEFTLAVNDEYLLPLTVKYGNEEIKDPTLTYIYETEGIVSINSLLVTALSVGETRCVVTASYQQKEVSKSFKVTVY